MPRDWNEDEISRELLHQMEDAERYLDEVRPRIQAKPAYEFVFAMNMARFQVFSHLHGKNFLYSRESLLEELNAMLQYQVEPQEPCIIERFERERQACIQELITRFSA